MTKIKKLMFATIFFSLIFLFTGCMEIFNSNIEKPDMKITIKGPKEVYEGETITLEAVIEPESTEKIKVNWKSNAEKIATVDENGVVTGIKKGRVTISATCPESDISDKSIIVVVTKPIAKTDDVPEKIEIIGRTNVSSGTIAIYKISSASDNEETVWDRDVTWEKEDESDCIVLSEVNICDKDDEKIKTPAIILHVKSEGEGKVILKATSKKDKNIWAEKEINVVKSARNSDLEEAGKEVIANSKNSVLGIACYEMNKNGKTIKKCSGCGFVYDGNVLHEDKKVESIFDWNEENLNPKDKFVYYLITNRHVVEHADKIKVYIPEIGEIPDIGEEIEAELIQCDDKVDLALIKFEYDKYIRPLEFADRKNLEAGDYCIAIGYPEGFDFAVSATKGIISYPLRYISDDIDKDGVGDWEAAYVQHDAAINPGNSGGPLLNLCGQVVGVNTLKFATTEIDNMGFSIPSNEVAELIPYLEEGKIPERAKIGVEVIAVKNLLQTDWENDKDRDYYIPEEMISGKYKRHGIYITKVTPGTVADGKLLQHDIIIEFNGVKLQSSVELRIELNKIIVGSGTEVKMLVLRKNPVAGKHEEKEVTLKW